MFRSAIRLLRAGDPAAANVLPELERFPDYSPGWLALGAFLQDCGKFKAAIVALSRATRSGDATFAEASYRLGLAQQDVGDHDAAARAYRAALHRRPDFHEAAFNLGVSLQEAGDLDAAIAAYGQALRLRPESLARIAQALTSARHGALWLDPLALRGVLTEALENSSGSDPVP